MQGLPSRLITVVDTGRILVNGNNLKFKKINYSCGIDPIPIIVDTIIERIGSIKHYFLPADYCFEAFDGNEGGNFRCYQDDEIGLFNPDLSLSCDFIVSTNMISNKLISINNPVYEKIHFNNLNVLKSLNYQLFNCNGNHLENGLLNNIEIDISKHPSGIYFVLLNGTNFSRCFKVIKQ